MCFSGTCHLVLVMTGMSILCNIEYVVYWHMKSTWRYRLMRSWPKTSIQMACLCHEHERMYRFCFKKDINCMNQINPLDEMSWIKHWQEYAVLGNHRKSKLNFFSFSVYLWWNVPYSVSLSILCVRMLSSSTVCE